MLKRTLQLGAIVLTLCTVSVTHATELEIIIEDPNYSDTDPETITPPGDLILIAPPAVDVPEPGSLVLLGLGLAGLGFSRKRRKV